MQRGPDDDVLLSAEEHDFIMRHWVPKFVIELGLSPIQAYANAAKMYRELAVGLLKVTPRQHVENSASTIWLSDTDQIVFDSNTGEVFIRRGTRPTMQSVRAEAVGPSASTPRRQ